MAATATTDHPRTTPVTLVEVLLGDADTQPVVTGLPRLPEGWQHAGIVRTLAAAPAERRGGILALGFALLAALWAPLGIAAVLTGTENAFLALSLLAVVLVVAPRPSNVAAMMGSAAEMTGSAAATTAEVASMVADRVGPTLRRTAAVARDVVLRGVQAVRDGWAAFRAIEGQSSPSSTR